MRHPQPKPARTTINITLPVCPCGARKLKVEKSITRAWGVKRYAYCPTCFRKLIIEAEYLDVLASEADADRENFHAVECRKAEALERRRCTDLN